MEEAIRVCIRQRPLFQKEIDAGHVKAWKLAENGSLTLEITPPQGITIKKAYAFDICFDDHCKNQEVYEKTARDIVRDTAKGINGCYMAYGQTGCGKTHSIMGTAADPGVLPRSVAELFDLIEDGSAVAPEDQDCETEYLLRVSYVEIYLERVNDLFQDGPKGESSPLENLDVKEDPKGGFFVVGLAEREVSCIDDVMRLLQSAEMKRHFASTNFNETSSRSHTVFTTILEATQTYSDGTVIARRGELKLVDLAGNERASAAEGVEGAKERLAEGQAINKSLFLLSEVIAKLSKRAELLKKGAGVNVDKLKKEMLHIPWRDSKLTRLLQKALGGNSRACLLVAVHPSTQALEISLSTLRFALKTKQIKKKIVQNFVSAEQSLIMQQKDTISRLRQQLMALQEMTGVEAPVIATPKGETTRQDASPRIRTVRVAVDNAATNETVEKLKQELQKKVDALSKLILHTKFDAKDAPENEPAPFARSVTITGFQDRFRRLQTLPENVQRQLYARPADELDELEGGSRSKSIAGTLKYLKNITAMNEHGVQDRGKQKDADSSAITRYDTIMLDQPPSAGSTLAASTQKYIAGLKLQNSKLVARNNAYEAHINYMKSLFHKLGLSLLVTSTDVSTPNGRPSLSYSLAATGGPSAVVSATEDALANYIRDVQPLAYAMLSKLLCNVIDRETVAEEGDRTLEERSADLLRDQRFESKVDCIFALLSPWEQHVLALFYEQQEVRTAIRQLTARFTKETGELQKKIQTLMAEKMELIEHSTRLTEELREFRYEEIPKGESGMNEAFGRLLKRMDALSMELAERTAESKILRVDYLTVEKERDELQKNMEEMKGRLFTFDMDVIPDDLGNITFNDDNRKLLRELLLSRHLLAETRIRLEESHSIKRDLRTVNQQLWTELCTVQASLDKLQSENKFLGFELKNERATLQKKFEESYQMCKAMETECAQLKRELAKVTEQRDEAQSVERKRMEEKKDEAGAASAEAHSRPASPLPVAAAQKPTGGRDRSLLSSEARRPPLGRGRGPPLAPSRGPLGKRSGVRKPTSLVSKTTGLRPPVAPSLSRDDKSSTRDRVANGVDASSPSSEVICTEVASPASSQLKQTPSFRSRSSGGYRGVSAVPRRIGAGSRLPPVASRPLPASSSVLDRPSRTADTKPPRPTGTVTPSLHGSPILKKRSGLVPRAGAEPGRSRGKPLSRPMPRVA